MKATTTKKLFSRTTTVEAEINSDVSKVWNILTNSSAYSKWNSTIISLDGNIEPGGRLQLISTLDEKRKFKLKIIEFDANKTLVWGDAMGKRRFELSKLGDDKTKFSMSETIGGPIFPLFASQIPPFDESFEKFAKDLKNESEK